MFPNLMGSIDPQIQESQQTPNTKTMKKTTPRYIRIKGQKPTKKGKMWQVTRGKKPHKQQQQNKNKMRMRTSSCWKTITKTVEQHL